jgi:hypothetical protein
MMQLDSPGRHLGNMHRSRQTQLATHDENGDGVSRPNLTTNAHAIPRPRGTLLFYDPCLHWYMYLHWSRRLPVIRYSPLLALTLGFRRPRLLVQLPLAPFCCFDDACLSTRTSLSYLPHSSIPCHQRLRYSPFTLRDPWLIEEARTAAITLWFSLEYGRTTSLS